MSLARLTSALCLSALLAACGGDDPKPDPESGVDPVLAAEPAADEVIVINAPRYLTPTSDTLRAEAFTGPVEVLLPTATGYTRLSSTPVSTGRASVRNVPAGASYLVRTGNSYLYTSARVVQRGYVQAQRPDVVARTGSSSGDVATVSLSGLAPWNEQRLQDGSVQDSLQLNAQEVGGVVDVSLDLDPGQGATSIDAAAARLNPVTGMLPALNGTESLTLTQRTVRDGGVLNGEPVRYIAARRAAALKAPAFDGSGPLQLSAAMQELPQSNVTFDLRGSRFATHLSKIHPDATPLGLTFYVAPAAYGLEKYGWVGYSGELLMYGQEPGQEADFAATFSYGNPFPSTWGRVATVDYYGRHSLKLPSGTSVSLSRGISVSDTLEHLAAAPITPVQLPPANLKVDGSAAQDARTLASLTPTVSWDVPAEGVPTAYALYVYRYNEPATGSTFAPRTTAAVLRMPASVRSLQLPEGILESGRHYVFVAAALRTPSWDLAREHTLWTLPAAFGDTVSGLMSTP